MKALTFANRGMGLETLIEYANKQYEAQGIALVQKIPTPVKVTRISGGRIKDGFFEKHSTVDYIGVYRDKPIAFDAKSTQNKTNIPLGNFERHQVEYLERWEAMGGIAFFLVEFAVHKEIYFLSFGDFFKFWAWRDRESIPYSFFVENCKKVEQGKTVLDYLVEVDK